MHRILFSNWKVALLWAIGISASVAAFFADGGGHEQLEQSAQQIRDKRASPYREDAADFEAAREPAPAASADPASEEESDEPAFGEPSEDPGIEGEEQAAPAASAPRKAAEADEEF